MHPVKDIHRDRKIRKYIRIYNYITYMNVKFSISQGEMKLWKKMHTLFDGEMSLQGR